MQTPPRFPLLLLVLALLLAATGCGGGGGGSSAGGGAVAGVGLPIAGTATIRGFITDPRTGAPVEGALVKLQSSEGADPAASPQTVRRAAAAAPVAITLTDARGFYEFANIAPANYAVSVDKDGQLGASFVVRATTDTVVDGTIQLTPIVTLAGRVIAPRPPAGSLPAVVWILGKSLGSLGEPVADTGGNVTWRFEIAGVPLVPGARYPLSYSADGSTPLTSDLEVVTVGQLTFRGASLAVTDFRVTLPDVTLVAAPPEANLPPSANAGPDQAVAPGAPVTLAGSGIDPEGRSVTFAWTQVSGPAATLSSATVPGPVFTAGSSGTYVFALVVSDGASLSAADYVSITVTAPSANRPPTATVGADQTVNAPATVTLAGLGNDPDAAQTLTYRWIRISGPTVTLADAAAATTTFAATEPGEYVFAFTVSDGTFTSSPAFLRVTVNGSVAVNRRPTANAGEDQGGVAVGASVTLTGTGSDPDGDALSYRWAQVLGTPVTLSAPGAATTTFPAPLAGIYVFSLTVTDGALDATDYVQVLVADPANAMPVANAGADIAVDITNGPVQVTLDGSGSNDSDGDPLTYSWMQTGGPPATLSDYAAAQPTFTADTPGILYFSLVVADGVQLSEPSFVRVSVIGSSIGAPSATLAAAPATLILDPLSPATVTLTATAAPALPASTFRFAQVSGPAATLAGTAGTRTFTPTVPGAYLFMVTADNGSAVSIPAYAEVRVSTAQNQTPVADAGADQFEVRVGDAVTLDGSLSADPDAGPGALTFLWTQTLGPGVALAGATTAAASFTPSNPGIHEFQLEVFDGEARAASRVRVAVNHPPVAKIGVLANGVPFGQSVPLNALDSFDPDLGPGPLTYNWSVGNVPAGATASFSSATADMPSFTATHAGVYRIYLTVNDGLQGSAPAEAEIRFVIPAPDPIEITVEQNPKGTPDAISGQSGSVPADAALLVSATNTPPYAVLATNFADGNGAFSFTIGDNDPRIRNDEIFLAVTDPAGTPGPFVRLVNDVTPPAAVRLAGSDPLPPVRAANAAAYPVAGRAEPGSTVELVMSLDPVHRIAPPALTANGLTGDFAANLNLSNASVTPDGEGYTLFARAVDAAGNAGAFVALGSALLKDTEVPELTSVPFVPGDKIKPNFTVAYTVAKPATRLVATLDVTAGTDPGAPHVMTVEDPELLELGDHAFQFVSVGSPVEGATYTLNLAVSDRAGNLADYDFLGLVCDATAPAGISGFAPSTGTYVFSEAVFVSYDLSTVTEPVVKLRVYVGSMTAGEDPRTPFIVDFTDAGLLTAANHPGVKLPLPAALTPGVLYRFTFEFADAAGNLANYQTQNVGALPNTSRVVVERPAANGKTGAVPKVTYTFSDAMATATFEFKRVSGAGPLTASHSLAGGDLAAGLHSNVPLASVSLTGGDVYNVVVRGRTANGLDLDPLALPNVTVDATAPAFLGALAEQTEFGAWRKGDRVLFRFGEAMDIGPAGQLDSTAALNAAFGDTAASGSTWGNGTFDWSSDRRTLTFTVDGPTLPDFKAGDPLDGTVSALQASAGPGGGRDEAGNLAVGGPHKLGSRGDVTAPALRIAKPAADSFIGTMAEVHYELNERLAAGELRFDRLVGPDPVARRILELSGTDLVPPPPGTRRVIDLAARGFTLPNGTVYSLTLSGRDGAGNSSEVQVGGLTMDTTPPGAAPNANMFGFHNYSGNLLSTSGSNGTAGEYICVKFGADPTVHVSILPAPYFMNQTVISGIPGAPFSAGTQVWLAWQDQAGNRTSFVQDGVIPAAPVAGDLSIFRVAYGGSGYDIQPSGAASWPDGMLWTSFDMNSGLAWRTANVGSVGTVSPIPNAIPSIAVQAGRNVYYMAENPDGNVSDYSPQDGTIAALSVSTAFLSSGAQAGQFGTGDAIRLVFTHPVATAGITQAQIAVGPVPAQSLAHQWPAALNEINLALQSQGTADVISSFTATVPGGSGLQHDLTFTNVTWPVTPPPVGTILLNLRPYGTTAFTSPGDHLVLPYDKDNPIIQGTNLGSGDAISGF